MIVKIAVGVALALMAIGLLLRVIQSPFRNPNASPNAQNTQIIAIYPITKLKVQLLTVRGSGCGLSWSKGFLMAYKGSNTWTIELNCPKDTPIEIKVL